MRARLRTTIKRLLAEHGYPPDAQPTAIQLVLAQIGDFRRGVAARDGSLSGRRHRRVVAAGGLRPATLGAVRSPKRGALDEMVAQATVDCYNDSECVTGFYTMLDEHLDVPFQAIVLGVDVTVTGIDLTDDDQIVAICARGRSRQRIPIAGLPLPTPRPEGAEWIEAYRHWLP